MKRLKEIDRKYIEKVYKSKSPSEIADILGVTGSTIKRELGRCPKDNYSAAAAQKDADEKHKKLGQDPKAPVKSYWQRMLIIKQIETCIKMQPGITSGEIARITGIEDKKVSYYFSDVKKEMMETAI
ncbi:hypothetical protein [uncultured Merdimonas sp.]|uniref:hypothetical protein n=1 Tax=uncultured Merdimonas sp. TaxID=2023269 RepID=UPI00320AC2EC